MAEPYLADPAVGPEAAAAALKIIKAITKKHRKEALAGARKVLAAARDEKQRKAAEKTVRSLDRGGKKRK